MNPLIMENKWKTVRAIISWCFANILRRKISDGIDTLILLHTNGLKAQRNTAILLLSPHVFSYIHQRSEVSTNCLWTVKTRHHLNALQLTRIKLLYLVKEKKTLFTVNFQAHGWVFKPKKILVEYYFNISPQNIPTYNVRGFLSKPQYIHL